MRQVSRMSYGQEDAKEVQKEKLYDFLREMEFNRLLSQAISFYGESQTSSLSRSIQVKKNACLSLKKDVFSWTGIKSKIILDKNDKYGVQEHALTSRIKY